MYQSDVETMEVLCLQSLASLLQLLWFILPTVTAPLSHWYVVFIQILLVNHTTNAMDPPLFTFRKISAMAKCYDACIPSGSLPVQTLAEGSKEGIEFYVVFNGLGHIATRLKPGTGKNFPIFLNSSKRSFSWRRTMDSLPQQRTSI